MSAGGEKSKSASQTDGKAAQGKMLDTGKNYKVHTRTESLKEPSNRVP